MIEKKKLSNDNIFKKYLLLFVVSSDGHVVNSLLDGAYTTYWIAER